MLRVRTILFPTDFSPTARQALEHALFLAEFFDAELEVLHAVALHPFVGSPGRPSDGTLSDPCADLRAAGEKALEALAHEQRESPVRLATLQRDGLFADAVILARAAERDVDLLVIGTHGERGRSRLLGGVARQVVHFATCPVLVVPARPDGEMPMIETILVPVDFSPPSLVALRHARELAMVYGATLDLVHVIEVPGGEPLYDVAPPVARRWTEALQARRAEHLAACMQQPGPKVPFRTHVVMGRPATAIVAAARELASGLVVMASHGVTGLGDALLGTTAERVLAQAPCPVFVWRADGKSLIPRRAVRARLDGEAPPRRGGRRRAAGESPPKPAARRSRASRKETP